MKDSRGRADSRGSQHRFERSIRFEPDEIQKELVPAIERALGAMLERDESLRPFVILEDLASSQFVQWCGSKQRPLRFEAPVIGVALDPEEREGSAERAVAVLVQQLGAKFSSGVLLVEADSHVEGELSREVVRPRRQGEGLYEWVDESLRSDGAPDASLLSSCMAIVHHLGVLVGIGIARGEVEDFVRKVHEMIHGQVAVVDPSRSVGANLDAMVEGFSKASRKVGEA